MFSFAGVVGMTTTITAEEKRHILCYLKEHKIPKTLVAALAGYSDVVSVNKSLRDLTLQPRLRAALIKIGAIQ